MFEPEFRLNQSFLNSNESIDDTYNTKDELISFDSSSIDGINRNKGSGEVSLNLSKSASNFGDVLRI